jgi:hypothetical protein
MQDVRRQIMLELESFGINLPRDYTAFLAKFEKFDNTVYVASKNMYNKQFHNIEDVDMFMVDFAAYVDRAIADAAKDVKLSPAIELLLKDFLDSKDFVRECKDCGIDLNNVRQISVITRLVRISKEIGKSVVESAKK